MDNLELVRQTATVVSSYVGNHNVALGDLPALIGDTFKSLSGTIVVTAPRPEPAVAIKKSITPNYLICLEDGKKLKMLKRHLKTAYGLTPDQYRERWGLAADYPMVSPNYSEHRSMLAKKVGLGHHRGARRRARKQGA